MRGLLVRLVVAASAAHTWPGSPAPQKPPARFTSVADAPRAEQSAVAGKAIGYLARGVALTRCRSAPGQGVRAPSEPSAVHEVA